MAAESQLVLLQHIGRFVSTPRLWGYLGCCAFLASFPLYIDRLIEILKSGARTSFIAADTIQTMLQCCRWAGNLGLSTFFWLLRGTKLDSLQILMIDLLLSFISELLVAAGMQFQLIGSPGLLAQRASKIAGGISQASRQGDILLHQGENVNSDSQAMSWAPTWEESKTKGSKALDTLLQADWRLFFFPEAWHCIAFGHQMRSNHSRLFWMVLLACQPHMQCSGLTCRAKLQCNLHEANESPKIMFLSLP